MTLPYDACRESLRKSYLKTLTGLVRDLDVLLGEVERAMEETHARYRARFPACRLVLLTRRSSPGAPPQGLNWYKFLSEIPRGHSEDDPIPFWKRLLYIRGDLIGPHIYSSGLHAERPILKKFRAARPALNEAHKILSRALDAICRILTSRFPSPAVGPDLERLLLPLGNRARPVSKWSPKILPSGAALIDELVSIEIFIRDLCNRYRQDSAHPGFKLRFTRDPDHPYGRVRWSDARGGWLPDPLTRGALRSAHVPRPLRESVYRWELRRRSLSRDLVRHSKILTRINRIATPALQSASRLLLHARRVFAPAPIPLLESGVSA